MVKFVYHASSIPDLELIQPKLGTHNMPWVYATKDVVVAAAFMARSGDFALTFGRYNGEAFYITERYKGAFNEVYSGVSGSIYQLDAENFKENKTSWSEEVVSDRSEKVVLENKVENVKTYLLSLEKEGKIRVSYYPERYGAPSDDQDLVERAVTWSIQKGKDYADKLRHYHHEDLIGRYEELLEKTKSGIGS
jgi:hypothetical protein